MTKNGFHDLVIKRADGSDLKLDSFKDKVVLVVNIASECGFTPQIAQLEELRKQFADAPFEILAVPCNDFAGQEPLSNKEIVAFCDRRFSAGFLIAEKSGVKKGANQNELHGFLSNKKLNGRTNLAPIWNFHKYLIAKDGTLHNWFFPFTKPTSLRVSSQIKELLQRK